GVGAAGKAGGSGSSEAVKAVRDGGRLPTITADLPGAKRGITMLAVQVKPDGRRLADLMQLLAHGALTVSVADRFPLQQAAAALARARSGANGSAVILQPGSPD